MRAREFTINVPITISINGDDEPVISTGNQEPPKDDTDLHQNPVMVPPQQQELELAKAAAGKDSPVIDKLTGQETVGEEPPEQNDIIQQLKAMLSR
jgi:hypothetical protein